MTRTPSQVRPSIKSGYARSAAESAYPGLWRGLNAAAVPGLGNTGDTLHDFGPRNWDVAWAGTAGITEWAVKDGKTTWFLNVDNNDEVAIQDHAESGKQLSVFTSWYQNQLNDGVGHWLVNKRGASAANQSNWQFLITNNSGYYLRGQCWDTSQTQLGAQSSTAITTGWHTGVAVYGHAAGDVAVELWQDGKYVASSGTLANARYHNTRDVVIGNAAWSSGFTARAYFESTLIYDRALSHQEIQLLNADPLAPFRLRRQVMFAAPTEAAAAAYHIYLSMLETGRFGINNGQLGVRES